MGLDIKSLADGQLPLATGILYTCPADTNAIIKTIKLVNRHTAIVKVNLYLTASSGIDREIIPHNCQLGIGYLLEDDSKLTLEAGDTIKGDASVANVVDYTISGLEGNLQIPAHYEV